MEYIDLRGTSYDSPAVCKYTGEQPYKSDALSFLCSHSYPAWKHNIMLFTTCKQGNGVFLGPQLEPSCDLQVQEWQSRSQVGLH